MKVFVCSFCVAARAERERFLAIPNNSNCLSRAVYADNGKPSNALRPLALRGSLRPCECIDSDMPPKPEHPLGFGGRPGLSHAKDECCPTLHSCRRCTERELNSSDLRVDLSWHRHQERRHLLLPLNWPLSLEKSDTSNATAPPVSGSYDPLEESVHSHCTLTSHPTSRAGEL